MACPGGSLNKRSKRCGNNAHKLSYTLSAKTTATRHFHLKQRLSKDSDWVETMPLHKAAFLIRSYAG